MLCLFASLASFVRSCSHAPFSTRPAIHGTCHGGFGLASGSFFSLIACGALQLVTSVPLYRYTSIMAREISSDNSSVYSRHGGGYMCAWLFCAYKLRQQLNLGRLIATLLSYPLNCYQRQPNIQIVFSVSSKEADSCAMGFYSCFSKLSSFDTYGWDSTAATINLSQPKCFFVEAKGAVGSGGS